MSSILIHGGTKKARKDKAMAFAAEKGIDSKHVEIIDQKKMGIAVIKEMISKVHVSPYGGGGKAVIILEAQRLTKPAQNTLLKTLEEPPAHLTIILTAPSPKLLLPTVVSRCLITKAQSRKETQNALTRRVEEETLRVDKFIKKLLAAAPGKRLAMFEEEIGYSKDDVMEFFDEVEVYFQKNPLRKAPAGKTLRVSKRSQAGSEDPQTLRVCRRVEECGVRVSQKLQRLWRSKKLLRDETANVKLVVDEWLLSC